MMAAYRACWRRVDKTDCGDVARLCEAVTRELAHQFKRRHLSPDFVLEF